MVLDEHGDFAIEVCPSASYLACPLPQLVSTKQSPPRTSKRDCRQTEEVRRNLSNSNRNKSNIRHSLPTSGLKISDDADAERIVAKPATHKISAPCFRRKSLKAYVGDYYNAAWQFFSRRRKEHLKLSVATEDKSVRKGQPTNKLPVAPPFR